MKVKLMSPHEIDVALWGSTSYKAALCISLVAHPWCGCDAYALFMKNHLTEHDIRVLFAKSDH